MRFLCGFSFYPLCSEPSSFSAATRLSQSAQRSALREQRLRADPNVEVLGPVDVRCKRCGSNIKLSMKSTYDPFHWQRHIDRCTKRPIGSLRHSSITKLPDKVSNPLERRRKWRGGEWWPLSSLGDMSCMLEQRLCHSRSSITYGSDV